MKKVLFALIALFSFVSTWAEDAPEVNLDPITQVKVDDYIVTFETSRFVALFDTEAGVTAPVISSITKGEDDVEFDEDDVLIYVENEDPYRDPVPFTKETITEEAKYFLVVPFEEGNYNKLLYVPFYVIEPWEKGEGWTRVNDQESFNRELWDWTGAYYQYYQKYPWCDVWYQYGDDESEGVILYPGQYPSTESATHKTGTAHAVNGTDWEVADANEWWNELTNPEGDYINYNINHSWYATQQSNPDNIVFKFAPMLTARVVNHDPEDFNNEDNVYNSDGTCRVVSVYDGYYQMPWGANVVFGAYAQDAKRYGLMTVQEPMPDKTVPFDETKFAMLLVPSNEEGWVETVVDFSRSAEVIVNDNVEYDGQNTDAEIYSVIYTGDDLTDLDGNELETGDEMSEGQYYIAGYLQADDVDEEGEYEPDDIKEYPNHVGQWVALVAFGAAAPEVGECAQDGSIWNYDEDGMIYVGYAMSNVFTVNPAPLKMDLGQITPYFGQPQEEYRANYTIDVDYYKKGDSNRNVTIINETYKGETTYNFNGNGLSQYGETPEWYLGDEFGEWWRDPRFNKNDKVNGAAAFRILNADRYQGLHIGTYEYTINSAQVHPCTVIDGVVYENYYITTITDAQCILNKNKVTITVEEGIGKLYGDVDPSLLHVDDDPDTDEDEYQPGVTVIDKVGSDMTSDAYTAVNVTVSRAKDGKFEDAGNYAIYVDITGEFAGNFEVVGKEPYEQTTTIDPTNGREYVTGLRYKYDDAFSIWPYDISEEDYDWDNKVIIEIDDVTYNGTAQQVKPKAVKFLDVNNVFSAENTTNEYVAGTEAVEGVKFTQEEIDAAVEGDAAYGKTTDDYKVEPVAAEPAYVLLAENTDWVLAYLDADGKGTQKTKVSAAAQAAGRYTYYYNGYVVRDAEWNVVEKKGECHIEAVEDDFETDANEGSINFWNDKFGYFTVLPRPVHLKAVMADDPTTADVDESTAGYPYLTTPKFTLEEVETEATDDGFVLNEILATPAMDEINSARVLLVEPNVVFDYNAETMKNVGTYTVTASLNPDRTNKKIPYDYEPIFDPNADNFKVIKLVLEIASLDQDGYYKSMNGDVEMNPAVDADKAEMHKGVNVYTYVRPQIDSFPRTADDPETEEVEIATVSINSGSVPASVSLNDLVKLEQTTTKVGSDKNTIVISLKDESVSENYDITLKSTGNFNIAKLPEIHLSYDGALGQALEDHKGQTEIDVYLPKRNLFENVWSSFVLPFEVNVPELSHKLYYGLVNTLNTAINDGDVHFIQQAGDIDPNTPFLFKIGVKKNWADPSNADMYADVKQKPTADADPAVRMKGSYVASQYFEGVTIADVPTKTVVVEDVETEVPVEAGDAGYFSYNDNATAPRNTVGNSSFIGVYNNYTANAGSDQGDWFLGADGQFYGGVNNVDKPVAAVSAFVNKPVVAGITPRFFFDEGGVVTAIEGILDAAAEAGEDAEGAANGFAEGWYTINGIKLEGEPTTTGTYIYNGKKVFIQK